MCIKHFTIINNINKTTKLFDKVDTILFHVKNQFDWYMEINDKFNISISLKKQKEIFKMILLSYNNDYRITISIKGNIIIFDKIKKKG